MMEEKKRYPDFWIRAIGSMILSHQVETLGRKQSWVEQWTTSDYWMALLSGWAIGFLVWTMVSVVTNRLDKKFDWLEKSLHRIGAQLTLGVLLPVMLILALSWIQVKVLFQQDLIQNEFHLTELPFIILMVLLINLYYFAWYLYRNLKASKANDNIIPNRKRKDSYLSVLMVNTGKLQVPIAVKDIQFILKQGDYSIIKTGDRDYVTSASLDEMETQLDPVAFFRANRQVIVHFNSCKAIKKLDYGKLEVHTDPPMSELLVVSQKKNLAFRGWMANR